MATFTKYPKSEFVPGKPYGQGAFGNVITGKVDGKFVVVKILHSPVPEDRFSIFGDMVKLQHRSLVRFMGIIDQDPSDCPQMVLKHANKGNLLEWLRKNQGQPDQKTMNKFTCDIINGMEYLHKMKFVHGCLAARNILLDEFLDKQKPGNKTYLNAQITDYGMTRIINGTGANYYKVNAASDKTLPLRWMPMEAIGKDVDGGSYSGNVILSSDVWSFAVVLWEMWTKGDIPYGMTASNMEVRQNILDGKSPLTFHRPAICPEDVLAVMTNIFNAADSPDNRPTFLDLQKSFDSLTGGKPKKPKEQQSSPQQPQSGKKCGGGGDAPKQSKPKPEKQAQSPIDPNKQKKKEGKPGVVGVGGQGDVKHQREKSVPKNQKTQHRNPHGDAPPPPYTPPMPQAPMGMGQGQFPMYGPPTGFPSNVGMGMPNFPTQVPGYSQQPMMNVGMGMGSGYPYPPPPGVGPMGTGPPPPYAVATGAESTASLEQTVRELQSKIASMEVNEQVKELQKKIEGLKQQQKKPQGRGKPPHQGGAPPRGKGPRGGGHMGKPGNQQQRPPGQAQGQGSSAEMPGWMPLAGAAIAGGIMAGAAAYAAANANSPKSKGDGKNKKK